MRKSIYLSIMLLISSAIYAQDVYNLKLKDIGFSTQNCKFYVDSVIDNRFLKGGFGVAQKGLSNKKVPIQLPNGMMDIKTYLDKNLPTRKSDFIPITLVINQLWISERTGAFSEIGKCDLEIEFCRKDSSGKLWSVYEFERELEEKSSGDVTAGHESRLRQLLFEGFNELAKQDISISKGTIFENQKLDSTNNIVRSKILNKGFYKSFSDFYNNSPKILKNELSIVPTNKGINQYKLIDSLTNRRIKNFYGYCDGEHIYINAYVYGQTVANYYSKVISFGKYMLLDDEYKDPMATAALVSGFGLLGGLIADGIAKKGMVIDMQTGQVLVLTEKNFEKILSPYPNYWSGYNKQVNKGFEAKIEYIVKINQQ